jgi:hypothetical protein
VLIAHDLFCENLKNLNSLTFVEIIKERLALAGYSYYRRRILILKKVKCILKRLIASYSQYIIYVNFSWRFTLVIKNGVLEKLWVKRVKLK